MPTVLHVMTIDLTPLSERHGLACSTSAVSWVSIFHTGGVGSHRLLFLIFIVDLLYI